MIMTGRLRRRILGGPQKLRVVKTGSNPYEPNVSKPKPERDIAPGTKIGGKMLVTGGMGDRVMNQKRIRLMEKVKANRARVVVEPVQKPPIEPVVEFPPEPPAPEPEKKKRGRPKKEVKETE